MLKITGLIFTEFSALMHFAPGMNARIFGVKRVKIQGHSMTKGPVVRGVQSSMLSRVDNNEFQTEGALMLKTCQHCLSVLRVTVCQTVVPVMFVQVDSHG